MIGSKLRQIIVVVMLLCAAVYSSLLTPLHKAEAQAPGSIELIGAIEAMSSSTITVNQQIIGIAGAEISTPLQLGVVVKVEGTLNPDGSIVARQIKAVAAGVTPGEVEFVGTLDSYSGSMMVVNGQSIDVSRAQIQTGVTVGQLVKVHATATGTGGWVAREVQAFVAQDAAPRSPNEFEITGTLEAISATSIVVSGQQFSIVGAEINGTLVVGVRVKVHASSINGVLVAREVELTFGDTSDNSNANANDNSGDNANANSNGNENSNDNSAAQPAITAQQAVEILLRVYPNAVITRIRLQNQNSRLVWEVRTAQGVRMTIDAQTGNILTIDQRGGRDDNQNANGNTNDNSGSDDNGNGNANDNGGSDDNGNGNSNDNGSGGEDDSGMGGMG